MSLYDRLHDLYLPFNLLPVLVFLHVVPDVHNFASKYFGSFLVSAIFGKYNLSKTSFANLLEEKVVTNLLSVLPQKHKFSN